MQWQTGHDGDYFRGGHDGYSRLSPRVLPSREVFLERDAPRVIVRDLIDGTGIHTVAWRFHFDPSIVPELTDGDCRLTARAGDAWMLPIGDVPGSWRLDRGWISPSYGVRHETSVLVIEYRGPLPVSASWLFADARLSRADRQQALDRVEARAGAVRGAGPPASARQQHTQAPARLAEAVRRTRPASPPPDRSPERLRYLSERH
jgi:hypothetical protein